jgi:hypothetical protein
MSDRGPDGESSVGWGVHEEEEVAALRREIAALEAEIVDRQTELIDLRVALDAFRARYEAQVGGKVRRLEAVEAEIDRCRAALRLHGQWGRKGPPPGRDGAAHVPVGEQYRRTWIDPPPPGPTLTPPRAAAPDAEIRGLYRRLCLRFHPDLTREEGERAWRNEVMIAVNAAYAARDLAQLRAIAIRPRRVTRARPPTARPDAQALAERLGHLRRTLRRLEGEVDQLTHSPLLELSVDVKLAAARGRDLLAEIAADVEAEWADRRVALADLRAQLRARGAG